MNLVKILLYIILGGALFALAHNENTTFFGVKLGLIWKAMLFLFLILTTINLNSILLSNVALLGLLYSVKLLFYDFDTFPYWLVDFGEAIKFATLPLLIYVFSATNIAKRSKNILIFLSAWLSLSCVPYFFGLEPNVDVEAFSLEIYGSSNLAFIGIFSNPHTAAVTLAANSLLLVHIARQQWINKMLAVLFLGISLIGLYLTFARTGWLAFAVGLAIYIYFTYSLKKVISLLAIGTPIALAFFVFLYSESDIFRMRLSGTNIYVADNSLNQLTSGRLLFWSTALEGPSAEGFSGILFGLGLEQSKDIMESKIGWRIFSHNGFLDAYQNSGLVGLILFIAFVTSLLKWAWRERRRGGQLAIALVSMFILIQSVQGGTFWWLSILLGLSSGLMRQKYDNSATRVGVFQTRFEFKSR